MQPITIRLLGALAPNTEAGTILGPVKTIPVTATAEVLKKSRRVNRSGFLAVLIFIASNPLSRYLSPFDFRDLNKIVPKTFDIYNKRAFVLCFVAHPVFVARSKPKG